MSAQPSAGGACELVIRETEEGAAHAEIERAADELFREYFGGLPWDEDAAPEPVPAGHPERTLEAVADGTVVGFVRVIEAGEYLHLEQVSVDPAHARRGYGRALVDAVLRDAGERGFRAVTLRTFSDVPWNAPFYERCGFAVLAESPTAFHDHLVGVEERLGLMRAGARVLMVAEPIGAQAV